VSDNYPTEDDLKRIEAWPIAGDNDLRALFDFVRSLWWMPDWGFGKPEPGKDLMERPVLVYHVSTGGWSGNEDIIEAMHNNFVFWHQCWQVHRAGGHYVFHLPTP
jgi:hypothetical protein